MSTFMEMTQNYASLIRSGVTVTRGGDSYMEETGMLIGNFEFNP